MSNKWIRHSHLHAKHTYIGTLLGQPNGEVNDIVVARAEWLPSTQRTFRQVRKYTYKDVSVVNNAVSVVLAYRFSYNAARIRQI